MGFLPHLHAVSALQDHATDLIRDTEDAPVGITRDGRLVAALISPEDWAMFQELKHAAERAFWTLDAERAARDVAAGDVEDWANVVSDLRGELGGSSARPLDTACVSRGDGGRKAGAPGRLDPPRTRTASR